MKKLLLSAIVFISFTARAQTCDCKKEFLNIKHIVENNFSGFPDRVKYLTKKAYDKEVAKFLQLSTDKFASDNCPLIIYQYLDLFKSHHLGFSPDIDFSKTDTAYTLRRPVYPITDAEIERVKNSTSWEGIYYFTHDSSVKVAVLKDPTALHDYIGVTIESVRPLWRRGLIKFEGKLVNDSLMRGLLYMRNQRPKLEGFGLHDHNNMISGDWRRVGSVKPVNNNSFPSDNERSGPVAFKTLSSKTVYLKVKSFETEVKRILDSTLQANDNLIGSSPNLIIDLRDNGGGSDDVWSSLLPYIYTNPIRSAGVDILATPMNISGWKAYLQDKDLSEGNRNEISNIIAKMEGSKGHWVNLGGDRIDSSMKPKPFPQKIMVLVNRWCGSSTEEFLMAAKQSRKVTLAGENSIGNLDYSNVVEARFSCFPYTLKYATTRSRRLNAGQGIDNAGIAPEYYLSKDGDWVKEAMKILEEKK